MQPEKQRLEIEAKVNNTNSDTGAIVLLGIYGIAMTFCWFNVGPKLNLLVDALIAYLKANS